MHIELTASQKKLRTEIQDYFVGLMTPDLREATRGAESGDTYKDIVRQMGKDGWLTIGWPKEYGGQGRSAVEQLIFFEETQLAHAPFPFVTVNTVGPALMALGSEDQKKQFLPGIAAGEIHFAIGYTESGAGTDLASLKTSAIKDGDDYVINGTKVFTSGAEGADYIWLATRTDKEVPKHKGITIFIVDTKLPGFSFAPIQTVGAVRTNMTYYEDMRVPETAIAGELNSGWRLITSQLNHERIGLAAFGVHGRGLYERTLAWAKEEHHHARIIDTPWVRTSFAEAFARLEAMRLLNYRLAWNTDQGILDPALASAAKVYSTECVIEICRLLMNITGSFGLLQQGSAGAILNGDLEEEYRRCQINTFGGGVAEVMRQLTAQFGLGMPRSDR